METLFSALDEREKIDRLVCLASGAFVPFAAGIVFSESFSSQEFSVRLLYVGHLSLVVATATTAFLCVRWIHLARGLMRIHGAQSGFDAKNENEKVEALMDAAKPCLVPSARARKLYEIFGGCALLVGLASYILAAVGFSF